MTRIFTMSKWIGIPTYGNKFFLSWTFVLFALMSVIEVVAIANVIRYLAGRVSGDERSITPRFSGCMFYGSSLLSLVFSWRFINMWKKLSLFWSRAELLDSFLSLDKCIEKRTICVASVFSICAMVEHLLSMLSETGFEIPAFEIFHSYIMSSHGFLLTPEYYSLWIGILIFIIAKIATILWNFLDLIIILISMGLTSRYRRLNSYVNRIVKEENAFRKRVAVEPCVRAQKWRKVREAYARQAALVRMVDHNIGPLVLVSNVNNFYFICIQLFLGLNKSNREAINSYYYFISLGWLMVKACSVMLVAANIHVYSKEAITNLCLCPSAAYNIEVKRLKYQLTNDYVALSGMGYFRLDRHTLLEVVGNIIKYELVMIQYDK
ncbi:hypothetical protein ACJJTC_006982 [Scirpophaga incertulas]